MPSAFITGSTGQDGSYLAELLRQKGYEVHGFEGELANASEVRAAIATARPDECYHLAAQTFVLGEEISTVRVNVDGTVHVLDALRAEVPNCRLFFAGSAEMFGGAPSSPQDETMPWSPRNVYGASKVAAWHLLDVYRQQYGIFACCGILYNHESPRRSPHFVTRKITAAAARIRAGQQDELLLGNLDTVRDWGHARDYVRAMWMMLQADTPDDYVVATGAAHTVRDFVEASFTCAGLDWQQYVRSVPEFWRPTEAVPLVGNPAKICRVLGWAPETSFRDLVSEMTEADLAGAGQ